jgi:hypothetical protein
MRTAFAIGWLLFVAVAGVRAQDVAPHAIDIPPWFTETFLDFRDDVADAARGRRLMVSSVRTVPRVLPAAIVTNFRSAGSSQTRRHFVAIALNIWGDRDVTWLDGRTMSEKALARA